MQSIPLVLTKRFVAVYGKLLEDICLIVMLHCHICIFRSVSATLPTGQLSNVPWRRSGVKYTNNEAYFDVTEEVDAIIDKSGATVAAEIQGYVSMHDYFRNYVIIE